ncbi:MAG: hypothetical protein JSW71_01665 [Gemmatimonadota bacterium]|nr:MAG: hypothetical protein JSW71_01665 [Gemmatimonadota bacterium]
MIMLPDTPQVAAAWRSRLERLSETTSSAPPPDLAALVREELGIDLSARYGGVPIPHPFGKASGQLSHKLHQVEADIAAGIAFIVLKTVVAEDAAGRSSMGDWAVRESKMLVERRTSRSGREGWTVTWKGRGWPGSLHDYLGFFQAALFAAAQSGIPVIPSVKYHLPSGDEVWRSQEYEHTTGKLLDVWREVGCGAEMLLEKDLSPTLAADERAGERQRILDWLARIPALIEQAAPGGVRLGIKLMNALFDDDFQVEMVAALVDRSRPRPAFAVVFNRLFDLELGVAYGGWDLSDRNLRVLDLARQRLPELPHLSATGNICSGKVMVEYALRGCENGQLHTFFQVPLSEYTASAGSRTSRALHSLMLHPEQGLAVWLRHLHEAGSLDRRDGVVHFLDLVNMTRNDMA